MCSLAKHRSKRIQKRISVVKMNVVSDGTTFFKKSR